MSKLSSVAIIIPVYSGYSIAKACLESVLSSTNEHPSEVLVIYDFGPESELETYLDTIAATGAISLYKNAENLGFVKTVNKAFSIAKGKDCIILNSDTLVPDGWLDRLVSLSKSDRKIATITPFTNNGEICSFPKFCKSNSLIDSYSVADIDDSFKDHVSPTPIDLPTGVGFCMYITAKALSLEKGFDEKSFGRGYGEENDLCVRLNNRGYRNVLCTNLFVYHSGGESFGPEKRSLTERATKVIEELHPGYHESVFRHVQLDPAKPYRLQALLSLIAQSNKPTVLMVLHSFGGGTERYVDELVSHHSKNIHFLCLRPSGNDSVSLDFPAWAGDYSYQYSLDEHRGLLKKILHTLNINLIHVNHIKGIEALAFELLEYLPAPHIVTLHDYYFISDNPTLTNEDGYFDSDYVEKCLLTETDIDADPKERKDSMSSVLSGAINVLAPSSQLLDIYGRCFPGIDIQLSEHIDAELAGQYPPVRVRPRSADSVVKVVAIGALGKEKGADILEQAAIRSLHKGYKLEFHLIGYAYRSLHRSVITHGQYQEHQLSGLIENLNPAFIWFPGLCAESYSYTLSTALEMGMPVMAPDIGALFTRTKGRPATRSVSRDLSIEELLSQIILFSDELLQLQGKALEWHGQINRSRFYLDEYYILAASHSNSSSPKIPSIECIESLSKPDNLEKLTRRERILRIMVRFRSNRVAYKLLSIIPFSLQRKVKRLFSHKSIHEL